MMDISTELTRFIMHLKDGDRSRCTQMAHAWESQSISDQTLYNDLLLPALCAIGQQWASNEITITEEHAATEIIKQLIAWKSMKSIPTNSLGTVIVGCVPDEHHSVAAMVLTNLLEKVGFRTYYYGESVPHDDMIEAIKKKTPDAVCLASRTVERLDNTIAILREIHRVSPASKIILGGIDSPHIRNILREYVDAFADCPVSGAEKVRELIGS